jgi:hypothetical protein
VLQQIAQEEFEELNPAGSAAVTVGAAAGAHHLQQVEEGDEMQLASPPASELGGASVPSSLAGGSVPDLAGLGVAGGKHGAAGPNGRLPLTNVNSAAPYQVQQPAGGQQASGQSQAEPQKPTAQLKAMRAGRHRARAAARRAPQYAAEGACPPATTPGGLLGQQ